MQGKSLYKECRFTGAILRQLLFGTTRMGVYNSLYAVRRKQVNEKGKSMSFLDRAACGTVGGMCGALVGNSESNHRKSIRSCISKNDK